MYSTSICTYKITQLQAICNAHAKWATIPSFLHIISPSEEFLCLNKVQVSSPPLQRPSLLNLLLNCVHFYLPSPLLLYTSFCSLIFNLAWCVDILRTYLQGTPTSNPVCTYNIALLQRAVAFVDHSFIRSILLICRNRWSVIIRKVQMFSITG